MKFKEILFGQDARTKILNGVNITNQAVSSTLGPRGSNVIFEDSSFPTITKDGVTVAQQVFLKDKFENLGVMITREAAENTNREAGDGTTSTVVLLNSIFSEGHKYIVAGMNPILIKRGMDFALQKVLEVLNSQSKEIATSKERLQIATISANNDEKLGELIHEVIEKIGTDGVVTVQTSNASKTEVEYVQGTKIDSGYESHVFINEPKRLTSVLENPNIIITTDPIHYQAQLIPLIQKLIAAGKRDIVLFADKLEGQALQFLVQNHLLGKFTCVPIKMPSFGDYRRDLIYDLAALTNATVLGIEDAKKIEDADIEDCGTCETIVTGRQFTIISGAKGDISKRIDEVKGLLEDTKDTFKVEKLKERLGRLTGSIANIKIGGASETEQTEIKYRIEDALNATKSAIQEGVVEGGGCALLRCINKIDIKSQGKEFDAGVEIVKKSLVMPLKTIVNNGGGNGEAVVGKVLESKVGYNALTEQYEDLFKAGIIDPKKVVKAEITNAVATAGILLTSSTAIVHVVD
jgi:chaperonin GroEL